MTTSRFGPVGQQPGQLAHIARTLGQHQVSGFKYMPQHLGYAVRVGDKNGLYGSPLSDTPGQGTSIRSGYHLFTGSVDLK